MCYVKQNHSSRDYRGGLAQASLERGLEFWVNCGIESRKGDERTSLVADEGEGRGLKGKSTLEKIILTILDYLQCIPRTCLRS